ncbi:Rossmann-fold NAD(P)-binding domain-containing protein [Bifidobacterium commune]|uniref:NAD(P)H-binding protein n=1 Tax=Bifidobacterium commune TaxID=1505727 RepID=UPI00190CA351|nr:NAD(P)H-binding protein [Bifidobacterium commune]
MKCEEADMADGQRVVILGGHGKVALLTESKLKKAGFAIDAVIRNPSQADDVREAGANPVVFDMEHANVDSGEPVTPEQRVTSHGNVAAVIARVITAGVAKRKTVVFYDGDNLIDEVLV